MTLTQYNKFYLAWLKAMHHTIKVSFFFTKLSALALDIAYDREDRNN